MLTLPRTIGLLHECFVHAGQPKSERKGIIYWIYRKIFMRNAERSATFLIDGIVKVEKDVDYDVLERHTHEGRKTVIVKDPDGSIYNVTMRVELVIMKLNPSGMDGWCEDHEEDFK